MTLECVVNLSEGADGALVEEIAATAGAALLDLHRDSFHNRSVLTLASTSTEELIAATERLAAKAVARLDLRTHSGVHPRLGVVDVVPFAPIGEEDLTEALAARRRFAGFAATTLRLPCFFYGPERSLPEVRRRAFVDLGPDLGPGTANPSSGACCVGARPPLVAYNVVLKEPDLELAGRIARSLRSAELRALAFVTGEEVQVSCNLISPLSTGPAQVYDAVAAQSEVARAELVGLVPRAVLHAAPEGRWAELDLSEASCLETRLEAVGGPISRPLS